MNAFEAIRTHKIIAIIRNIAVSDIRETAIALFEGGIRLMEVTFNQSNLNTVFDTAESIKIVKQTLGQNVWIGAGTVMTENQVVIAVDAGAQFIISPNMDVEIIKRSNQLGVVSIPGAFSPSEIVQAYKCGAGYVKLFPADTLGVSYIKAVASPLSHIPILAVGGINASNLQEYLKTGICGVGIGSNLVNNELIQANRFSELTKIAREYTDQIEVPNE